MRQIWNEELIVIKELVMNGDYHYSTKIREYVEEGWYQEDDLEHCICTATHIHKVEDDELKTSVDGKKYTILGRDNQGEPFYTCGKIILSRNNRKYFFITAHESR